MALPRAKLQPLFSLSVKAKGLMEKNILEISLKWEGECLSPPPFC